MQPHADSAVCGAGRHNPATLSPPEDEPDPRLSPESQEPVSRAVRPRHSGFELDISLPGRIARAQVAGGRALELDPTRSRTAGRMLPPPISSPRGPCVCENTSLQVCSWSTPLRLGTRPWSLES